VVSASALDDAEKNYEMALNKQNVSKANCRFCRPRLAGSRAGVAGPRQPEQLEDSSVTPRLSRDDGIVLSRDVEWRCGEFDSGAGFHSHAGDDAGDTSEVYVKAKWTRAISARSIWDSRRESKLSRSRTRLHGKVTKISPMGVEKDNVTTFEVRVSINNPEAC